MDPLESLVCSLVPQARESEALRSDLVSHSKDILNRLDIYAVRSRYSTY